MEDIKDRLAHILRSKNLTAAQFAEMMGIQPSNVSHLLSGRNNPRIEFFVKLKEVFPEYSFDWLIMGKKPITMVESAVKSKDEVANNSVDLNLFETHNGSNTPGNVVDNPDNISLHNDSQMITDEFSMPDTRNNIKRIIMIYDDDTFSVLEKHDK